MLSPVSSRAPQSQTLYAQQVPIDAGKVTEVYLDAMSHIFIKVVVMNDMNIGSYKSNTEYWGQKIQRNRERDAKHMAELTSAGWKVLTVWECEVDDEDALAVRLRDFLG